MKLRALAFLLALAAPLVAGPAVAQGISQRVATCDPSYATRCLKPAADGSIVVTGGGGGPVTIADGADVAQGATADGAYSGSGDTTVVGALKAIANSALSTTPTTVQGAAASGASFANNPLGNGCKAATTDPTAVTDGQVIAEQCGATGKRIVLPYAIKELQVRGSTGAITNTAQTSIIASAGGSLKNYITAIQCSNSGSTTSILTFTDSASTVLINPAGGGGSWTFPVPLVTAAATAFQVTPGSSSTSQYCSAQGYTGL